MQLALFPLVPICACKKMSGGLWAAGTDPVLQQATYNMSAVCSYSAPAPQTQTWREMENQRRAFIILIYCPCSWKTDCVIGGQPTQATSHLVYCYTPSLKIHTHTWWYTGTYVLRKEFASSMRKGSIFENINYLFLWEESSLAWQPWLCIVARGGASLDSRTYLSCRCRSMLIGR